MAFRDLTPIQREEIKLKENLKKRNVRFGSRRMFWVSVSNPETGETYREWFQYSSHARERAVDLALEADNKKK